MITKFKFFSRGEKRIHAIYAAYNLGGVNTKLLSCEDFNCIQVFTMYFLILSGHFVKQNFIFACQLKGTSNMGLLCNTFYRLGPSLALQKSVDLEITQSLN